MENNTTRNNYALFVDLENCGGKVETLKDVIEKVKIRGDILLGIVYGYNDRYAGLKELLLSNTFTVVPSLRWGYNQKNNLDIQLVIDALELAFLNERIDCFCIVSGDSDYTPLVGKLKSMGKFVLGISRSEVASKVFINACNEFVFLESVAVDAARSRKKTVKRGETESSTDDQEALNELLQRILREKSGADDSMYASELKKTLCRLKPDFNEKNYGHTTFGKLLAMMQKKYKAYEVSGDSNAVMVKLTVKATAAKDKITKDNWKKVLVSKLNEFKEDGFDRVNPSIIKASLQGDHPGFDEKEL
ncbi:MAG: NYN domain-containing protein, partial [Clostridiales bacterium]|nr:NYN domain-containing protein [Clostridiales bacterium]